MNGVADPIFIDTNILIYATMSQSPFNKVAQQTLQRLNSDGAELWISRQILREYLAVLTRTPAYGGPIPMRTLTSEIASFTKQYNIAEDSANVMTNLLNLISRVTVVGPQVHDANIVATMQARGIERILTRNIRDFNLFAAYLTSSNSENAYLFIL